MNCNNVRENLIELLAEGPGDAAITAHVKECNDCARELDELRKTMALLDEWEAPALPLLSYATSGPCERRESRA